MQVSKKVQVRNLRGKAMKLSTDDGETVLVEPPLGRAPVPIGELAAALGELEGGGENRTLQAMRLALDLGEQGCTSDELAQLAEWFDADVNNRRFIDYQKAAA